MERPSIWSAVPYPHVQFELAQRLAGVAVLTRRFMARGRRSENSVTEEVVQLLTELPGTIVSSKNLTAGESRHGADLEIWFRGGGFYFVLHLQAKRLSLPGKRTLGGYPGLHKRQSNGMYQLDLLRQAARPPRYAGYLFYNDFLQTPKIRSGCCSHHEWAARGQFTLMVCDADSIEAIRPGTTVGRVLPLTVPLHCLAYCELSPRFHPAERQRMPLPIRAAQMPWRLAGGQSAMIARDPDSRVEVDLPVSSNLEVLDADTVPDYVRVMAVEGTGVPLEGEDVPEHVVLIDEDAFAAATGFGIF